MDKSIPQTGGVTKWGILTDPDPIYYKDALYAHEVSITGAGNDVYVTFFRGLPVPGPQQVLLPMEGNRIKGTELATLVIPVHDWLRIARTLMRHTNDFIIPALKQQQAEAESLAEEAKAEEE